MSDSHNTFGGPPSPPPHLQNEDSRPAKRVTSGAAKASVILGFFSFGLWIFAAIPALVLALLAKSDIRANPARLRGSWLATLGLLLSFIGIFAPFIWILLLTGLLVGAPTGSPGGNGDRIAHIHLAGSLSETPAENFGGLFMTGGESLKGLVEKIDRAAEDDSVKALLFTVGGSSLGFGQLEEVSAAIQRFKATGKNVYAHGSSLQTGTYALLANATHLNVIPTDTVWLAGISMRSFYVKDAMEKVGLQVDVVKSGTHKAAGETFSRMGPSEAAHENNVWLLDGLYAGLVDIISEARGLRPEVVTAKIDGGPYTSERALEAGLVDSVLYQDEFIESIREEYGDKVYIDNYYGSDAASAGGMSMAELIAESSGFAGNQSIAIVYVEGPILSGSGDIGPLGSIGAFSGNLVKILDRARTDDSIKAVVMRIDSPGGSAVASEEILRAAIRLEEEKPLVVSMGSTAASGGYYIACKADAIFADEMTITASIGVIGLKLVTSGMWEELGVNWSVDSRGKNANLLSGDRPFSEDERAWFFEYMEETYAAFTGHVTEGRGGKLTKPIEEIAGGRVFTGKQALELGLVDQLGGLTDAIEFAADEANIKNYKVRVLPEPVPFAEALMASLMGIGEKGSDLHFEPAARLAAPLSLSDFVGKARSPLEPAASLLSLVDEEGTRAAIDTLLALTLIRKEGVAVMMTEIIEFE